MKKLVQILAGGVISAALLVSCANPLRESTGSDTGSADRTIEVTVGGLSGSSSARALIDDGNVTLVKVVALNGTTPVGESFLTKNGTTNWKGSISITGSLDDSVSLKAEAWKGGSSTDSAVPYVILYSGTTSTNLTLGTDTTASITVSAYSSAMGWCNLQSPATLTFAPTGSGTVYAQAWVDGVTTTAGDSGRINAWIGLSSSDTDPATWAESAWTAAAWNAQVGNNDEYTGSVTAADAGTYYYATRFQVDHGAFSYGGTGGVWTSGTNGVLTVAVPEIAYISKVVVTGVTSGTTYALPGSSNWLGTDWDNTCMATVAASGTVTFTFSTPAELNTVDLSVYAFSVVTSGTWDRPGIIGTSNLTCGGLTLAVGSTYIITVDTTKVGNAAVSAALAP